MPKPSDTNEVSHPERLAPSSPEAEDAVLGSVLINPDAILEISQVLQAEMFYIVRNGWVWAAIIAIHERGEAVDNLTVIEELKTRNQLDSIGGAAYITYLINNTPTHIHAETYARIVKRAFIRRAMLNAAQRIGQLAMEESTELDEILEAADTVWDSVAQQREHGRMITMREAVSEAYDELEARSNEPNDIPGFTLGLKNIDHLFGGFDRGWGIHWLMPTSGGKTLLTGQCLLQLARQTHTMLVSTEMHTMPMVRRLLSQTTGVSNMALRTGKISDDEMYNLQTQIAALGELPITFLESRRPTIQEIKKRASRLKRRLGDRFGCLIVDAGSNIQSAGNGKIFDVTRDVATGLSELQSELDILVMVTWQINRASYSKKGPGVTAGRGGGDIENEADFLFSFERPEYGYKTGEVKPPDNWDRKKAQIQEKVVWHCNKDRHMSHAGATFDMWMRFKGRPGFYDMPLLTEPIDMRGAPE